MKSISLGRSIVALATVATVAVLATSAQAETCSSLRAPRAPAAAKSSASGGCAGLARYEIVRSTTASATCAVGNVVLGGACTGIHSGEPAASGAGWTCPDGERATATCALLCSALTPSEGGCCQGGMCVVLSYDACVSGGGRYLGDGAPCDDLVCAPRGACCIATDPLCLDDQTQAECEGMGGIYVGDDTTCDSDPASICYE